MSAFNAAFSPALKTVWTPVWGAVQNLANQIKALFATGQQGAWYDPSDMTTLYQDSRGNTPVTAMEQPVGLMLDKSLGLIPGPELVTNGTFDTNVNGWLPAPGGTITWTAGTAVCLSPVDSNVLLSQTFPAAVGKYYLLSYDKLSNNPLAIYTDSGNSTFSDTATGRQQFIVQAANAAITFIIAGQGAFSTCTVDNLSCKLLDGNHAVQPTAINRPVLSARINLLTKTEQMDQWLNNGLVISPNAMIAPDGTLTADTSNGAAPNSRYTSCTVTTGATYTYSLYVKPSDPNQSVMLYTDGAAGANAVVATIIPATGQVVSGTGISVLSVVDGWYRLAMTYVAAVTSNQNVHILPQNASLQGWWGAQLDAGPVATRYQRVNTAVDYDAVGFPKYLAFNGVNSFLASPTGGGGTAGFFFCAAVKIPKVPASTIGIFNDIGSTSGYLVRLETSLNVSFYGGHGTGYSTAITPNAIPLGITTLVTAWYDGLNLFVQVGNGAVATVSSPVIAAGSAGFRMGTAFGGEYIEGNYCESIYVRNSGLTPAQRLQVQRKVSASAGIKTGGY